MGKEDTLISRYPKPDSLEFRKAQADSVNKTRTVGSYVRPFELEPAQGNSQGNFKLKTSSSKGYTYNIVEDFKWTTSKFKEEVPRIHLVEYEITQNQQAAYLAKILKGISYTDAALGALTAPVEAVYNLFGSSTNITHTLKDPYEGLYTANATKFSYTFPFYSPNTVNTRVTWSSKLPPAGESQVTAALGHAAGYMLDQITDSTTPRKIIEQLAPYSANIAGVAENANAPFAGIEQPMYYTGTGKSSYTIKFPLFNTFSPAETLRNYDFIRFFNFQNLHLRTTFATYQPPVFYKCEQLPDYWNELGNKPAVYVSNFVVQNVGAVRAIDLGTGHKLSIPEAYMVEITLSEMITTSRNIYSSVFTGNSINVIEK